MDSNQEVSQAKPMPQEKKNTGLIVAITAMVLAIAGFAGGIAVGLNHNNKCITNNPTNNSQPATEESSEITDKDTVSTLAAKANTVLSFGLYAQDSKTLGFVSTKNEVDRTANYFKYYTDVPDSARLRIILQQHKTTQLSPDGLTARFKYENSSMSTITTEIQALFGKNSVINEATAGGCPDIGYDSTNDYYIVRTGCGGSPYPAAHFYQYKYEKAGEKAYVYIASGTASNNQVLSDQLHHNLERTGDTIKIELPKEYGDYAKSAITSENYKDFAHYRLVFENEDGNYAYKTIEKVED